MEGCINFFTLVWKREVNGKTVKLFGLILLAAVLVLEMAVNPLALLSAKPSIQWGMEMPDGRVDHDAHVGIMDVEIPTGAILGKYFEVGGKIGNLKEMIPKEMISKEELSDAVSLAAAEAAAPDITESSMPNSVASDIMELSMPNFVASDIMESVLSDLTEPDFTMSDIISQDSAIAGTSVSDIVDQGSEITKPVIPDIEGVVTTNPGITIPAVPDVDVSGPSDSGKGDSDSVFLIDEAGMLYGFLPENAVIEDGLLELPTEGCIGIRKGAFADCGENIVELYIPSNISVIEEGAFIGLDALEWIDAAYGNEGCISVDGVLFDSSLTVLLAFPNGRTGAYIVPASVTRIADGAFANTSLSVLDMRDCGNVVMRNGVFGDSSGEGIEILMPRGEVVE